MPNIRPRRRSRIARLVAVFALAGGLATMANTPAAHAADDGGFGAKMLALVNEHRAAAGVAPLQVSEGLRAAAQDARYDGCGFPVLGRATDMGTRNYFGHTIQNCGTQGVSGILGALGVTTSGMGENIGWMNGTTDPLVAATRLTNDLMASPGHRANILSANFTHIGIGSWRSAPGQTWSGGGYPLANVFVVAQVFGRVTSTTTTAPPATPTSVEAAGGDGVVTVSFGAPASGPAPTSYGAFVWDSSGYTGRHAIVCATCRTATVTGVPNGRTYYVTVQGHNAAGWGQTATSPWVTVAAVPGAPTDVRLVPGNGSVTGSWRGPTNPGTAIDGYGMFLFDDAGYTGKYAWVCATCTTATVAGAVNGRSYFAVVYAHNANGWGLHTITEKVVAGTPGAPGSVSAARGSGSVNVTWTPASSSGTTIDMYGIFAFDANGYTGIATTACATCTSGTLAGLVSGRTYTIAVFAHNAWGWGVHTMSTAVVPA